MTLPVARRSRCSVNARFEDDLDEHFENEFEDEAEQIFHVPRAKVFHLDTTKESGNPFQQLCSLGGSFGGI